MKHFFLLLLTLCINYYSTKASSKLDSIQIENLLEKALQFESQRNLEDARKIYLEIVDEAKSQKIYNTYAKTLNYLGRNYYRNYLSDSAVFWLEKLHSEDQEFHFTDKKIVYSSFTYLGQSYSRLKKPFKCIETFARSIDYTRQNEILLNTKDVFLARAYNNTGVAYEELGDFETALKYLDSALVSLKETLDAPSELEAHIYSNKGNIYKKLGFADEALEFTSMQIKIYEQLPEEELTYNDWGLVYWYIASCYQYSNSSKDDVLNSIKYCEISENYFEKGGENAPLLIYSYYIYAEAYFQLGDYEKATFYIEKAIEQNISRFSEDFGELGYCYLFQSKIAEKEGSIKEAKALINKTIELYNKIDWKVYNDIAEAWYSKGNLLIANNDYEEAMKAYQQALEILLPDFTPNSILENPSKENLYNSSFLFNALQYKAKGLMHVYKQNNNQKYVEASMECFDLAYRYVKLSREETISLRTKSSYIQSKFSIYEDGIVAAYDAYQQTNDKKYLFKAIYFSDLSKSNNLLDKLEKVRQEEKLKIPSELLEEERKILAAISYNEKKLYDLKKSGADSSEINNTKEQLFEYKLTYEQIINNIQAQFPEYYHFNVEDKNIFDLDNFQSQILEDQLFVSYFSEESNLYVFALTKDEIIAKKLDPLSDFEPHIKNLINEIKSNKNSDYTKLAFQLYNNLFKPVITELKNKNTIKKIAIIPDGILGYLPFELLLEKIPQDGDINYKKLSYLINDFTFSYHNSLSIINFNRNRNNIKTKLNFLGFAPKFNKQSNPLIATRTAEDEQIASKLEMLPGALNEVNKIASLLGGETKTGEEATESNFKSLAKDAEILHLATHTIIDDENPLYSKLVFSSENDSNEDGLLYTYELFNMDLKADLVSLSSCNTGMGKYYKGEGVISLANGFMYAGIPNIMMSVWSVPDASTSKVMEYFYSALKEGKTKPEALRDAKLKYLQNADENLSHPYYWGAFMMIGNSNTENQSSNHFIYWLLAFVSISILVWFTTKKVKKAF